MLPSTWGINFWKCGNCGALVNYGESHTCPTLRFDIHGTYPPYPVPGLNLGTGVAELNRKLDRIIELLERLAGVRC